MLPMGGGVTEEAESSSRPEWLLGVTMPPPPTTTGETLLGAGLDPVAMATLGDLSSELAVPPATVPPTEVMMCDNCEEGETEVVASPFAKPAAVAAVPMAEVGVVSAERSEVTEAMGASEGGCGAGSLGAFLALMSAVGGAGQG